MLRDPWFKALVVLLVIIAASYLAAMVWALAVRFSSILLLVVLAWVLAFALEPVTYRLQVATRVPRGLAVALVYSGLLVILSLATLFLVPVFALQISQIGVDLPRYVDTVNAWALGLQDRLGEYGVNLQAVTLLDKDTLSRVESLGPVIVNNAVALATGLASVLFSLVIVLMLSLYMMLDGAKITSALLRAVPAERRDDANYLIYSTHRAFGGFIRGQLLQAMAYGVGTVAVMMVADLSFVAVASLFAFVMMLVPFIGPFLAMAPPVAIALFVHPDRAWWVFLLLLLLQQIVLQVLAPRVMSQTVGMHPLLVVISLLVGANLAGTWGAVFAVPVTGVIVAMVGFYRMTVEERKSRVEQSTEEGRRQAPTKTAKHEDGQPLGVPHA